MAWIPLLLAGWIVVDVVVVAIVLVLARRRRQRSLHVMPTPKQRPAPLDGRGVPARTVVRMR